MEYFEKIFKKNKNLKRNENLEMTEKEFEVAEQVYDSKFELLSVGTKELGALKKHLNPWLEKQLNN